uniref:NADH-ubiquinone oxidoreductase chain 2 n=2 Tax=Smaug TaxID=885418 RepID=Q6I7X3_9SAUR|nr:NADH dehydrogenase subunit 2 [Smaug warreni]BAD24751.1 NADH dehydrogenase subunit 2 [Smaug warreni]
MNPFIMSLLLSSLAFGTMITMSSTHWLIAWTGLEVNTLAIIPIMTQPHHPRATEAATKYFLTQAAASAMILLSSTMNAWHTGLWDITQLTNPTACALMTAALAMKLGLAPAHFWLPEVVQGTTIKTTMIITTWMKLAPMTLLLLAHNSINPTIMATMGVLSILIGGWGGLNQTQLRKIMGFSSISHLGWMTTVITLAPTLTILNLTIYITMTLTMFLLLIPTQSKTTQNMTTWTTTPLTTALTTMTLLSLGGLPPLTGFMPKWLILQELITQQTTLIATLAAIASLLNLFFYLRLSYITTLTISPNTTPLSSKWRFKPPSYTTTITMFILSTLALPITFTLA